MSDTSLETLEPRALWSYFLALSRIPRPSKAEGPAADWVAEQGRRLVLLTTAGAIRHDRFSFRAGDTIMVGRESCGVPAEVVAAAAERVRIPMRPGARSLNVALAAAMVTGEALRQLDGFPGEG